jgi:hypothetical protein
MKNLEFFKEDGLVSIDETGVETWAPVWYCTDGISTYSGETKSEAAAHFGVPFGDFD